MSESSSEQPSFSIRDQVLREIEEFKKEYKDIHKVVNDDENKADEQAETAYFNNFHSNLPVEDEDRPAVAYDSYRRVGVTGGRLNNLIGDMYRTPESRKLMSQKKMNMTWSAFFQEIDTALQECNIPLEKVRILQKEGKKEELYKLVKEAYIKLRENGYTKEDLVQ